MTTNRTIAPTSGPTPTPAPSPGELVADRLRRTVRGPMWHGPALSDLLQRVSPSQAVARPIAGAHSILELVGHSTAWAEIAHQRLVASAAGRSTPEPTALEDWPAVPATPTAASWRSAVARLGAAYDALADLSATLDADALKARVHGREYRAIVLLDGVVEHGTYHGGQIALLLKALEE